MAIGDKNHLKIGKRFLGMRQKFFSKIVMYIVANPFYVNSRTIQKILFQKTAAPKKRAKNLDLTNFLQTTGRSFSYKKEHGQKNSRTLLKRNLLHFYQS